MQTKRIVAVVVLIAFLVISSGCVVRTYTVEKDRVDQSTSGNRGYIQGNIPASAQKQEPVKKTRTVHVTEIELKSPIEFKKGVPPPKPEETSAGEEAGVSEGNRGMISQTLAPEKGEVISYKVQKTDTLQKISMKFFGTTKKWMQIYKDNKDVLKSPEKIYPGQVIKIIK